MGVPCCCYGYTIDEWAGRDVRTPSKWMRVSSANGLADVCQLYCGERIDKTKRNVFVNGTIADVRNDFQVQYSICYIFS